MALETSLALYKESIDAQIERYVMLTPGEEKLKKACHYALLNGGKRFRPALVHMVAKALGRAEEVQEAALAVEMFHTASLVVDDLPCMDNERERRNRPCLHCAYDEVTALLVSYALIAEGYGCLAKNCLRLEARGEAICALVLECAAKNTGLQGATGGQWLDLFPAPLTEDFLREVIYKKTASLFEMSFVLGWLFGGGERERLPQVRQAALHLGTAFQIVDDLDDEAQDLQNKKPINFALVCGREAAKKACREEIQGYLDSLRQLNIGGGELEFLAQALKT